MLRAARRLFREAGELYRFIRRENRPWRQVVFYAEHAAYFQYFDDLIEALLGASDASIGYLTSDEHDPILQHHPARLRAFYFKALLPFVLLFLDAKVLVLTTPELHRFHIRRSVRRVHHLYVFHAIVSTHMVYGPGAFDYYDTIFCVGPHHVAELRRAEELYGLTRKRLVEVGYHRLDRLYADHQRPAPRGGRRAARRGLVLVAPSWGVSNIMETCISDVVRALADAGYQVLVRPHPEFRKRNRELIDELTRAFASLEHVSMEPNGLSDASIREADMLVTDWSGIALEYAFGTERPVLFIDVPRKVWNPDYQRWGIEPVEVSLRTQIGLVMRPDEIGRIGDTVTRLIEESGAYRERIRSCRSKYVYHFGSSAAVGARHLLELCREA